MKVCIKYGLIFVAGAGIGSGVSYIVLKKKFEKDMDAHDNETREYFKELYVNARAAVDKYFTESDDIIENGSETVDEPEEKNKTTGVRKSFTEEQNHRKSLLAEKMGYEHNPYRTRYDLASKEKYGDEFVEEEVVDDVALEVNNDNPPSGIYIINADQFAHEKFGYDKVTLYWWELERLLTEEDLDILDVPDLIGYEWENRIGEFEKDVVYVRNESMETDYEVVVRHESFYEMRG